jgi:rfaE bifunctional protein kinase chain/domain
VTPHDLLARLGRSPRPRILVVGDLVADRYIFGRTDRISREAPVLIVRHEREEVRLGGAANAAWNLAALGAEVTALGALGRDEMGDALFHLCMASDIRVLGVRDERLKTECKTRILAGGVNTSRQQMLRLDQGQDALPADLEAALDASLEAALASHDAVLVSDYGAGVVSARLIARLCAAAGGKRVVVDSRYQLAAFSGALVLKPNEPELAQATGLPTGTEAEAELAARALLARSGALAVLVTRGREGMVLVPREGEVVRIASHGSKDAVDVTGAGDTVIATLTMGLASGGTLEAAARLANVAGGLVVQKPGTATVTPDELAAAMGAP